MDWTQENLGGRQKSLLLTVPIMSTPQNNLEIKHFYKKLYKTKNFILTTSTDKISKVVN